MKPTASCRDMERTLTDPNDVAVVVINFNGMNYLHDCFSSITAAEGPIKEVIMVDDASSDGGVSFVRKNFPGVRILRLSENSGPAAARNAGLKAATTDWVCFLDNDVVVDRFWLSELVKAAGQKQDASLLSSRVMVYEEPSKIGTDGLDVHFVGMPTFRNDGKEIRDFPDGAVREIGAAGGASILVNKKIVGEAPFDADFFYGFEDTDFCVRFRVQGRKCLLAPGSLVFHKFLTGGTERLSDRENEYSLERAFYVIRNRWFLIFKNYECKTIFFLGPALLLFEMATLSFAVRRKVFRSYLAAALSVCRNRGSLSKKRKEIQKTRKVKDRELLSAFSLSPGKGSIRTGVEKRLFGILNGFFRIYWRFVRTCRLI